MIQRHIFEYVFIKALKPREAVVTGEFIVSAVSWGVQLYIVCDNIVIVVLNDVQFDNIEYFCKTPMW